MVQDINNGAVGCLERLTLCLCWGRQTTWQSQSPVIYGLDLGVVLTVLTPSLYTELGAI